MRIQDFEPYLQDLEATGFYPQGSLNVEQDTMGGNYYYLTYNGNTIWNSYTKRELLDRILFLTKAINITK